MRELILVGCVAVTAACGGAGGKGADSARPDTTVISGPPAVTPTPSTPAETIASRPRGPDAGSTAGTGSKTAPSGATGSSGPVTPPPPKPGTPAPGRDSVRGIVSVVGTSFDRRVMIAGGGKRTEIKGTLATIIGRTAGAEVVVVGTPTGTSLDASSFVVASVDGAPAIDGTLRTEGQALFIVTAGGVRHRIVGPPPPFVGRDGARVWITGDPARGVASFGFIDPAR